VRFFPIHPLHVHLHGLFLRKALRAERFDVVHFNTPLPPPVRTGAPALLTFHTPVLTDTAAIATRDLTSNLYRLQTPVSVRIEKRLIRLAARVTAVSPSVAKDLQKYGLGAGDVHLLENGVDPGAFRPDASPREDFLLCTGRLGPRKGHLELIRAVALLNGRGAKTRVVVTGKGPLRAQLEDEARRLGVADLVEFRGFVSREELTDLLQRCRAFAFPSHYEGLPTSLLEAMAAGAPIVAAAAPGSIDLVQDGRNGLLVPVGDPGALADGIHALLADPAKARGLAAAARRDVEEKYGWDRIAQKAVGHYRAIQGERA
jgi:glycosyltransferase involved in cell wall biosynthesis